MKRIILALLLAGIMIMPTLEKDYGKAIQSDMRNTGKEIKKIAKSITTRISTEEIPDWYPNPDGSLLFFPLKDEDCFMVGKRVTLTSWYSLVRSDTKGKPYRAINIPARPNAPVYAIADGVVTTTGDARYFHPDRRQYSGMLIEITCKNGLIISYEHLNNWRVCEGDTVLAGDQIANVGGSGRTTGYHLRLLGVWHGQNVCLSDKYKRFFGKDWYLVEPGNLENVTVK